jgi:hypothetical protein
MEVITEPGEAYEASGITGKCGGGDGMSYNETVSYYNI